MNGTLLRTERLSMRPFEESDLEWLISHRANEDVVQFLGGLLKQTPEFVEKRMRFYMECFEEFGFSMCVTSLLETDRRIGVTGLQPLENTGEIEVGYAFDKDQWGKGLATECGIGWLRYGFSVAGLERIVAVCDPENTGSRRVMEKIGMSYEDTAFSYGFPVVRYGVSKADFVEQFG
ncbi:MAG: GNAT family N-acetyltransferase [Aridibacter famidurans]|nr:GNAT family N-acetyltransferase [Aridibacter famidurans]